jgi:hypothetical protein
MDDKNNTMLFVIPVPKEQDDFCPDKVINSDILGSGGNDIPEVGKTLRNTIIPVSNKEAYMDGFRNLLEQYSNRKKAVTLIDDETMMISITDIEWTGLAGPQTSEAYFRLVVSEEPQE